MSPHLVVDANVLVDSLAQPGGRGDAARTALRGQLLAGPEILRLETVSVLRKLAYRHDIDVEIADAAIRRLGELPIHTVTTGKILPRVWELRCVLTSYDAAYVAAAEHLDTELITGDGGIHGASGVRCVVRRP